MLRRIVRIVFDSIFLLVTIGVGVPIAVIATVLAVLIFLPLPAAIPKPKPIAAIAPTKVYDRNGNLIATFRQFDQSIPVAERDIPQVLKEAVVSVEDRNFYRHGGIDIRGSLRALVADLRSQGAVQGGSTITQQYVKLTYTNGQRNLLRKAREAILASQLSRQSSKDEILFRYLSIIYFGDGSYGIGAASQNYFRIPVDQLNIGQAALLAGLIAAPSAWAPRENPTAAESRRELVLDKMLEQGYITRQQHDTAMAQKLWLLAKGLPPRPATLVYPPQQDQPRYPAFVDYVLRYLLAEYGAQKVYRGGLRVQTTLNPAAQNAADQSVQSALKGTQEPLEMSLAAVEPQSGFVDAIVGGRQFGQGPYANVNFALGGCEPQPKAVAIEILAPCWGANPNVVGGGTGRQPGSAWKPFVLATAFSQGVPPTKIYPAPRVYAIPGCKGANCTISNNEGEGGGASPLRQAMWYSINTVYAQLIRDVGCPQTAFTARSLGVSSAWYSSRVQGCGGNYALGEVGVSPLDMASAYGVFDNHGGRATPTPILKVLDSQNHVLIDNITSRPATTQIIAPPVADTVTDVLRGVVQYGTGTAANIGRPAAGKTGTTSNFTNAWFVGYTPTLSTAVWMGYANNQTTPLRNVRGVGTVYGGTIPAQAWHDFMSLALAQVPPTDFSQPAPLTVPSDRLPAAQPAATIAPGGPGRQTGTPTGGPYQYGPLTPQARPPDSTITTTTTIATASTTSSTTSVPRPAVTLGPR